MMRMMPMPFFELSGRRLLQVFAVSAALLFALAAVGADEAAPVPRPDVKVGESWRYRVSIYQTNVPITVVLNSRITFVGPNVIIAVETDNDGREFDSQYDSDWGISALGYLGQVYDPPLRILRFPLQVGAEAPYVYGVAAQRGSAARTRAEGTVKVLGWEDVVVPAGKFRALKIETKGSFQRLDINGRGWQRFVSWYVPEVKRTVKSTFESGNRGPNDLDLVRLTEMVEFKVQ